MLIGYTLSAYDNDSYMCSSCDRVLDDMPGLSVCSTCSWRTDFAYTNPAFKIKRKKYDISYTYDGALIASERFRDICHANGYDGLEFRDLPKSSGWFHLHVHAVREFDAVRRRTRFENLCDTCGFYESVVGATPSFLVDSSPLLDGFCRSDLLFASRNEKHPLIFVGVDTLNTLKESGITGLCPDKIES